MKVQILNLPLLLTREEIYPFLNLGLAPGSIPANIDKLVDTYLRHVTPSGQTPGFDPGLLYPLPKPGTG